MVSRGDVSSHRHGLSTEFLHVSHVLKMRHWRYGSGSFLLNSHSGLMSSGFHPVSDDAVCEGECHVFRMACLAVVAVQHGELVVPGHLLHHVHGLRVLVVVGLLVMVGCTGWLRRC